MRYALPLLAAVLVPVTLVGQSLPWKQVVPDVAAATEGTTSTPLPFGSVIARRVMYAYEGSAAGYGVPVRIAAISLRCDGNTPGSSFAGSHNFKLDVSTGVEPANALATTFDVNHGNDRLRVHSGILGVPAPAVGASPNAFSLRIPFTVPFDWDPRRGPLVLDFSYSSGSPAFGSWDAESVGVGGLSANGAAASVATATLSLAPVVQLEVQGDVVPGAFAAAEAPTSTAYPWGVLAGNEMRVLNLYEGSEVAFTGRRRITGLAWRTDLGVAFPGRTFTMRVSMSTSGKTAPTMDTVFANNHGADLEVVFDGVLTAPATQASSDVGHFDVFCELQRPFEYDPADGALAIDIQVFGATGAAVPFDTPFSASLGVGRIANTLSASATTATIFQGGVALVTALRTVPVPTVPAALSSAPNPTLNNHTSYPFNNGNCRTLLLLAASEAGITEPFSIRHLRFRPGVLTGGPATFSVTIDLSHAATTPASISAVIGDNHGANRVRVFSGQFSVPFFTRTASDPEFLLEVELDEPYLWSPSSTPYLALEVRSLSLQGSGVTIETTSGLGHVDARVVAPGANSVSGTVQMLAPVVQLGGDSRNGLAINYGAGCIGTNGAPTTTTVGLPTLPNPDFRFRIRNALGNAAAVFFAGFAPLSVELPGAPGCDILHQSEVGILGFAVTDPTGDGTVALPLANDISMDGLLFRAQWIVLDPTANALGLVTSDAQALVARFF